jgi:DNA-binding NarL/FixJ family response regulator
MLWPDRKGGVRMKILVVDDHVLVRDALRGVLKKLKPQASILEARDCRQTTDVLDQHPDLDLILLDLILPDRDGFSMLAELRQRCPTTAVVVLSASRDQSKIRRALNLGALGFIPKTTERDVMLNALQLVFSGGTYIPTEILGREEATSGQPRAKPAPTLLAQDWLSDLSLTKRQIEVLTLMMDGRSNKAIAHTLKMTEPTVKNYVTVILKALKVANRTEAVIKVGKMGWEPSSTPES